MHVGQLKHDLAVESDGVIETHTAWVFLGSERVIKVKKPVDFGFLDFTSLERRRQACEAELELNSRLAPRVYLAVVPITLDARGTHRVGGEGPPVDWGVEMLRLPDAQRGDLLVADNRLMHGDVRALAVTLARFHANMPTNERISEFGSPQRVLGNIRENFAQTEDTLRSYLSPAEAEEITSAQSEFVENHRELFISRMLGGRVRDGHGDLRLEHVYFGWDSSPTVIDCIEFNERFRFADVCADIAFLGMDFAQQGRMDLGELLIAEYARAAGDYQLYRLIDFYEGYRAFIRGKVASMLEADSGAPLEARQRAHDQARRYYRLAVASTKTSLLKPAVVAVGGFVASGKSTIAERIAERMAAPVVDTDRTRKQLLGVALTQHLDEPPWSGAYAPAFSERVYGEVFERAQSVLASGRSVVLDASFRSREARARARLLARAFELPFYFVECRAETEDCKKRLRARAQTSSVSDAREDLFDEFVKRWEAVDELPPDQHIVLHTAKSPDTNIEKLERLLPTWPRGLVQ